MGAKETSLNSVICLCSGQTKTQRCPALSLSRPQLKQTASRGGPARASQACTFPELQALQNARGPGDDKPEHTLEGGQLPRLTGHCAKMSPWATVTSAGGSTGEGLAQQNWNSNNYFSASKCCCIGPSQVFPPAEAPWMSGMPEKPGMRWQRPPMYQESEQSICLYPHDAMQASQQPADEAAKNGSSAASHGRLYTAASE